MSATPPLTGRQLVAIGREAARRHGYDAELTKAERKAMLKIIAAELYPGRRYPERGAR